MLSLESKGGALIGGGDRGTERTGATLALTWMYLCATLVRTRMAAAGTARIIIKKARVRARACVKSSETRKCVSQEAREERVRAGKKR